MGPLSTVRQRLLFILIHSCFIDIVYATPFAIVNISLRRKNIVVVSCLPNPDEGQGHSTHEPSRHAEGTLSTGVPLQRTD